METHEKIIRARAGMIQSQRFFGFLALNLKATATTKVESLATDGKKLFYNPTWVDEHIMPEVTGVCAKMALHIALLHHTRRKGRDEKRWKKATDLACFPILTKAGFTLPESELRDKIMEQHVLQAYNTGSGLSAEAIFKLLPEPEEGDDGDGEGQGQAAGGGGGGKGEDQDDDESGQPDGSGGDPEGDDEGEGQEGEGKGEPTQPDQSGMGQVLDAENQDGTKPSPADMQQIEAGAQVQTAQATNLARAAGQGSLDQEKILDNIKQAQVDWIEETRRFVQQTSKNDADWCRPNKRFAGRGIYLPALHSVQMGTMVVAVDMSGSVTAWTERFGNELSAIIEDVRPQRILIIYATDRVTHVDDFTADELPVQLVAHGTGGTSFKPPFEYIEREGIEPACLIYLTDLYGDAPAHAPDYPVLWACCSNQPAPWGEVVRLKED